MDAEGTDDFTIALDFEDGVPADAEDAEMQEVIPADYAQKDGKLFDADNRLKIDKSIPDSLEIEKMVNSSVGDEIICKNLFIFVSCCVVETLKAGTTYRNAELYVKIGQQWGDTFNCIFLDSVYNEILFCHEFFPISASGQKKWPAVFERYVQGVEEKEAPASWKSRKSVFKSMPDNQKKACYFGFNIYSAFESARGPINNDLNILFMPAYKHELRSGESPSALMTAIRLYHRIPVAYRKACKAVDAKKRQLISSSKFDDSTFDRDAEVKSNYDRVLSSMGEDWFPEYWLAFALASLPVHDVKKCFTSFQTAEAASIQDFENTPQPASTGKRKYSSSSRSSIRDPSPTPSVDSGHTTQPIQHVVTLNDTLAAEQAYELNITEKFKMYESFLNLTSTDSNTDLHDKVRDKLRRIIAEELNQDG